MRATPTVRVSSSFRPVWSLWALYALGFSSPAMADTCSSTGYLGDCDAGGAYDICQTVGTTIVCDLKRNSPTVGYVAYAVLYSSNYEISGAFVGGGGDFCCKVSPSGISRVEVYGTDYDDEIDLNRAPGNLEAPSGIVTGYVGARDGDDVVIGSCATTHEQDDLRGANGADLIYGCDGGDYIYGENGADWLIGNAGDDIISGGPGADYVWGEEDDDTINGDGEGDFLSGNDGADIIHGNDGADQIWGGDDGDNLSGDAGDDEISGDSGGDTANGNAGDDLVCGNDGIDTLSGEGGDDFIYGNADADTVYAGADSDTVWGGEGGDTLHGDSESDYITGGDGADFITGDGNVDYLCGDREPDGTRDTLDGGDGDDRIWGPRASCSDTLSLSNQGDAGSGYDYVDNCSYPGYVNSEAGLTARPSLCPAYDDEDCPMDAAPAEPGGYSGGWPW